jgi:hypothetical protein
VRATGVETCLPCSAGSWSEQGFSNCQGCPANSNSPQASALPTNCSCNPGASGLNGDTCVLCPAGKFKADSGSAECTDCAANTYSENVGATASSTCNSCPANSQSVLGSTATTSCVCNVGFTGPNGGTCLVCVAGGYKDSIGSAACTDCAANMYSETVGATAVGDCQTCPSNTQSAVGSTAPTSCVCNLGFTGPDGGTCDACVAGKYKDSIGTAACTACAAGTYLTTTSATSAGTCAPCPADSSSLSGSSASSNCRCKSGYTGPDGGPCSRCVAGKYKIDVGSHGCTDCDAGKYSVTEGASSASICIECVSGTYLEHTGASAASTCIKCGAGKFSATAGASTDTTCTECGAGKYSMTEGANSDNACMSCPDHSISLSGSSLETSCLCVAGYTGPDGGTCEMCVAGKYKDTQGAQPCTLCIKGKYSTTVGASLESTCINCDVGKYSTAEGASVSTTCTSCSPNTYSTTLGAQKSSNCANCTVNSQSPSGSSVQISCLCNPGFTGPNGGPCTACVAGEYKDVIGSASCTDCGAGKYLTTTGAATESSCVACPGNSSSVSGSDSIEWCYCNPGYRQSPGHDVCIQCSPGFYDNALDRYECSQCGGGLFSAATGATTSETCQPCSAGYY